MRANVSDVPSRRKSRPAGEGAKACPTNLNRNQRRLCTSLQTVQEPSAVTSLERLLRSGQCRRIPKVNATTSIDGLPSVSQYDVNYSKDTCL